MPKLINLKKIRNAKKMTQKKLADMVEVSPSSISQYESGSKSPSFEVALKIAEALNCESADLVTERDGLLNLIEDKKIPATNSDGLTTDLIELSNLYPSMTEEDAADLLLYAKFLVNRHKSQDAQE